MTKQCCSCGAILPLEWLEKYPSAVQCLECFFWAITHLFEELPPETPEEVDAVLREAGLDPDKIAAEIQVLVRAAFSRMAVDEIRARGEEVKTNA